MMANYFDFILDNPGLNHISIQIFENIDLEALSKCIDVSEKWHQFIIEEIPLTDDKLED